MKENKQRRFNLDGKLIILTGGAGYLAEEFAKEILKFNGRIILIDINSKLLKLRIKKFEKEYKNKIFTYKCDLTSEQQVKKMFKDIEKKIGIPNVLINNAASNPTMTRMPKWSNNLENFSIKQWQFDIASGLTSAFLCTKYFGKINTSKSRVILNISSDLGLIAPNQGLYKDKAGNNYKPVSYSVVKHGIIGLTKYTATFWNEKNIRCNAVAFGGVFNNQNQKFLNKIKKLIPMNRMANKSEYNSAVVFLISDASSYMNGSVTVIDGGRTAW
mgnify:CR=1 FL=1